MRLIDANKLIEELLELVTMYPGSGEAIADAVELVCHAHVIEGKELEALVDDTDYEWLLEQKY